VIAVNRVRAAMVYRTPILYVREAKP